MKHRRRFTLVELMVVIAIIGLLASVVTVNVMQHMIDARIATAKHDIVQIEAAVQHHKIKTGKYPRSLADLFPAGQAPYVMHRTSADELRDPWGRCYIYVPPGAGTNYDIYTFGSDGGSGGQGEDADIHLKDALIPNG